MWLTATEGRALGASAHQFAVFRLLLGATIVIVVAAGLGGDVSTTWLELPRSVRTVVRVIALTSGLGVAFGMWRRASAALALGATLFATLYGFVAQSAGVQLMLLTLLAAWPALRAEPWALRSRWSPQGNLEHPPAHFTTAAWAVLAASLLVGAAQCDPPLNAVGIAIALTLALVVALRGPAPALLFASAGLALACALLSPSPLAHLLLLAPSLMAAIDEQGLPAAQSPRPSVVFFDGVCGFCQGGVQLMAREDRAGRLRFAPLQGDTARAALGPTAAVGRVAPDAPDSMVVDSPSGMLRDSDAALFVASQLGGAWRLLEPLRYLPRSIRDAAYGVVARNRYTWFGKLDTCPIPDARTRSRFLP